jgi:hypothetical protein
VFPESKISLLQPCFANGQVLFGYPVGTTCSARLRSRWERAASPPLAAFLILEVVRKIVTQKTHSTDQERGRDLLQSRM